MASANPSQTPFGLKLREWRRHRGLSQLTLAARAETTPRYVSFIETGRSRPGRDVILRLAAAMDLPLRERNALLASAGFGPAFPSRSLDDASMRPVQQVLEKILAAHEPFPAWVIDARYQIRAVNQAGEAMFPGLAKLAPAELIELWFAPGPFRDRVENLPEVVSSGLALMRRQLVTTPDAALAELLARAELLTQDVPRPRSEPGTENLPIVCPRLRVGDHVLRTMTTVMRFDTALDVTASELRVELMFPADARTESFFRALAQGPGPQR